MVECECHWTELVCVLLLVYERNVFELNEENLKNKIRKNKKIILNDIEKYVSNLYKELYKNNKQRCCSNNKNKERCKKPQKKGSYFCGIESHNKKTFENDEIKNIKNTKCWDQIGLFEIQVNTFKKDILKNNKIYKIYLTGKNYKNIKDKNFSKIKNINMTLEKENKEDSKKICKSDIYILFEDEDKTFIGISVKKDNLCTKFNYSVEDILTRFINIQFNKKRTHFLNDIGVTSDNFREIDSVTKKRIYNKYFCDSNNSYWICLIDNILKYQKKITEIIYENYVCKNNKKYEVYELHNKNYKLLNDKKYFDLKDLNLVYAKEKNKNNTKAAKLFYTLKYKDQDWMNLEIRFKGNPLKSSPQFLSAKCYDLELT